MDKLPHDNKEIHTKEFTYQISDIKLNYLKLNNKGHPILFLHGNMSRWQEFNPLIIELNKSSTVFAIDLRGHGKSTHSQDFYTLINHANDIESFITNIIRSPVTLIGNSLGGMIGYLIAAKFPNLINKLITFDSPLSSETLFPIVKSQQELGERILKLLNNKNYEQLYTEVQDPFMYESLLACDPKIIEDTFFHYQKMVEGYNLNDLFSKIKCPGIIFYGEEKLGSMISKEDRKIVSELAPQLKQIGLSDVGHSLFDKNDIILSEINKLL